LHRFHFRFEAIGTAFGGMFGGAEFGHLGLHLIDEVLEFFRGAGYSVDGVVG